jgi:iron complex outermembrane receptor protein
MMQKSNPDLRPEIMRMYEAVVEQYLGNRLRLVATGYSYKINGLITQETDPADGFRVFNNVETVKARGMELELEGKWPGGVEGRTSYVIQHTENGMTGEVLTNSPRHMAKLNLIAPLVREKLFSGVEVQYMSRRKTLAGNNAGAFTVANVTLHGRELLRGLDASMGAYNLFGETYGDPGGEEHVQDVIPQDGRSYRLKLTYRFGTP